MEYDSCYQLCIQRILFITKMVHKESCERECKRLFKRHDAEKDGKMAQHDTPTESENVHSN